MRDLRTLEVQRLTDDEKIKIMEDILNSPKETQEIKVTINTPSIIITVTEKGIYNVDSFLAASQMQKIFVKTGYFVTAFASGENADGKKYIYFYLDSRFKITSVNRDGEYWSDLEHKARCPNCKESEIFKLMKYDPTDGRDMTCPKCKDTNYVRSFFVLDAYEVWD